MKKTDTICAIATSNNSIAGISIIRISGKESLEISKKFITAFKSKNQITPRHMYLSDIELENGQDKCLAVYFNAPHSFTGEDVVELHLHGGITLTELALKRCLEFGCRLATRGEFSKRAFLNGKQSLDSLEGVIDIINAESEAELSANFNLANGKLRQQLEFNQTALTDILAEIEVTLDYPEEDIEYATEQKIKEKLDNVLNNITNLIDTNKNGKMLKNGINIAIIGKPNVGKSSLLNALLEYDRAIVTNIAGTTRDSIEDSFTFNGVKFNICDTAGIRSSNDVVESIGIERAINQIKSSNINLFIVDASRKIENEDTQVLQLIKEFNTPTILVINKIDIAENEEDFNNLLENENIINSIKISAKNNENISKLKSMLYDLTLGKDFDSSSLIITNQRHLEALKMAKENLEQAINNIGLVSLDCITLDIKEAWNNLASITGKSITEEVLDTIFSKFCLGK